MPRTCWATCSVPTASSGGFQFSDHQASSDGLTNALTSSLVTWCVLTFGASSILVSSMSIKDSRVGRSSCCSLSIDTLPGGLMGYSSSSKNFQCSSHEAAKHIVCWARHPFAQRGPPAGKGLCPVPLQPQSPPHDSFARAVLWASIPQLRSCVVDGLRSI